MVVTKLSMNYTSYPLLLMGIGKETRAGNNSQYSGTDDNGHRKDAKEAGICPVEKYHTDPDAYQHGWYKGRCVYYGLDVYLAR